MVVLTILITARIILEEKYAKYTFRHICFLQIIPIGIYGEALPGDKIQVMPVLGKKPCIGFNIFYVYPHKAG